MIVAPDLLADGRRLVSRLVDGIRDRSAATEAADLPLRGEYARAVGAGRTGQSFETWREERVIQSAVAWVLATVFARFCEDNGLVDDARIAGVGERLDHARDRQRMHFRSHPQHSDRDYLLTTFENLGALPGMGPLLDPAQNPLWALPVTADGASDILELFRRQDPHSGRIAHDFTDPGWGTRFLGDLYQDLSEDARKRYALLQTPEFVERFLLDRTLEPALDAFGLEHTTLIDPTCGSGHFLLGAFERFLHRWRQREPGTPERVLAQRALDAVAGVDLNPFAVAIARFRLLVAALRASHISRLIDAPGFRLRLAVGDSLLHGRAPGRLDLVPESMARAETAHVYRTEDAEALAGILNPRYAVVVGNPPYVTVKDPALNQAYRDRFESCHRQYSLGVPFTERFLDLAHHGTSDQVAGFVGMITADSFMKREFGKKLIEDHLPAWDLTHVIHTSGAYIPGHGTPTVVLLARARGPVSDVVRTVMGIRGEPSRPAEPAKGLVWSAIVDQVDEPGSESDFVSVADTPRTQFATHPWSIGGGGAAELKDRLDQRASVLLAAIQGDGGRTTHTGEDDAYYVPGTAARTHGLARDVVPLVIGEHVRDYRLETDVVALFPYDKVEAVPVPPTEKAERHFWALRTRLKERRDFGQAPEERGLRWFDHSMFFPSRYRDPLSIAFAFVATHNHFVLDRGGKVFKQSAPVIKLPAAAGEDAHLGLLGLLNSATACFWMQQAFHNKGGPGGGSSKDEKWHDFFELDGTKLKQFPLPSGRPLQRARQLDQLAQEMASTEPQAMCGRTVPTRAALDEAQQRWTAIRAEMIATQEELDWEVLDLYGVGDDLVAPVEAVPPLDLGQRAFEIVLARKVAAGEVETAWFARHRSTPITGVPEHWPEAYRRVVKARISRIEGDRDVGLIERPECKRRWAVQPWEQREKEALRAWLLDRLEGLALWQGESRLRSTGALADHVRTDVDFVAVAGVYTGRPDSDLTELVTELVAEEAVPFLAALRYSEAGLRKRGVWERTWDLQRAEDAGEDVGTIPVPPKYAQGDFSRASYWKLRGKLDVAKERFVSYPHAGRDADPTPVVGWAGWDHRQQALALATWLVARRDADGWDPERLTPLLAGLAELLPWVRQWHPEVDPGMGQSMGDYFTGFLDQTLLELGLTAADLARWRPPAPTRGRRRRTGS